MRFQITKMFMLAVPLLFAAVACDSTGVGDQDVSISFAVERPSSANVAASLVDPVTVNGHTLDLQSADVTFSRIKLDREESTIGNTAADADSDSEADSDEEEEIRFGPTTVSLPLQGGVITPITTSIPAGDYESIELKTSSVRLRGTYDGQPFDVNVPLNFQLEQRLSPPFKVASDADRLNITVQIDLSRWLRADDGALIDPRVLATNASLRSLVANRIRSSFKAFEDSDRDADDEDSDSDSDGF